MLSLSVNDSTWQYPVRITGNIQSLKQFSFVTSQACFLSTLDWSPRNGGNFGQSRIVNRSINVTCPNLLAPPPQLHLKRVKLQTIVFGYPTKPRRKYFIRLGLRMDW
jgi:hypothetical protein